MQLQLGTVSNRIPFNVYYKKRRKHIYYYKLPKRVLVGAGNIIFRLEPRKHISYSKSILLKSDLRNDYLFTVIFKL